MYFLKLIYLFSYILSKYESWELTDTFQWIEKTWTLPLGLHLAYVVKTSHIWIFKQRKRISGTDTRIGHQYYHTMICTQNSSNSLNPLNSYLKSSWTCKFVQNCCSIILDLMLETFVSMRTSRTNTLDMGLQAQTYRLGSSVLLFC